jgi:hypothetical protein
MSDWASDAFDLGTTCCRMKMNLNRWAELVPPVSEQRCFECGHNTVKNIPSIQEKKQLNIIKIRFSKLKLKAGTFINTTIRN